MDQAKSKLISKVLLFIYLAIFPLGQLIRFELPLGEINITVQPVDLIALSFLGLLLVSKNNVFPQIKNSIILFFGVLIFSQLIFMATFGLKPALMGVFYLIRLLGYSAMFLSLWGVFLKEVNLKNKIIDYLIVLSTAVSALGWMQYWLWPDLRILKALGWDDHLFRLVGTFLDPGYTGIIIVFGVILSFIQFQKTKKLTVLGFFLLNLGALVFTYSRASYLAFMVGIATLFVFRRKLRIPLIVIPLFLATLFFLPRPEGEGVRLERTASIFGRFDSYKESVLIFSQNPLFGVGYNNLCWYREKFIPDSKVIGHACGGADSSLLYILVTGGIVGLIMFLNLVIKIYQNLNSKYKDYLLSAGIALLAHSFFANSIFYSWVMGYWAILLAVGLKKIKLKN